jgi:hypothetical protein
MVQWNDVLAYSTPKVVKVRDWRLGLMNYLFQFAIFIYVVVWAIILQKGFMMKEQITGGSVTVNSRRPSGDARASAQDIGYCCDEPPCESADKLPCLYWDELMAEYPPASNSEMSITSRVNITRQVATEGCNSTVWADGCEWENDQTVPEVLGQYVANLENFTLRIRHGTRGEKIPTQGTSTGLNSISGVLKDMESGDVIRRWPDDELYYGQSQGKDRSGDILALSEILDAVNLDLDEPFPNGGATARYDGITIIVNINYEMVGVTGTTLKYVYEPRLLSQLEYKIEDAQMIESGSTRDVYNRHAVRLIFVQTGEVGAFDMTALLITMVTALGLLAVSATVTNFVMSKFLSLKDFYNFHTTDVTEDYDTLMECDPNDLAAKLAVVKTHHEQGQGKFLAIDPTNASDGASYSSNGEKTPLLESESLS